MAEDRKNLKSSRTYFKNFSKMIKDDEAEEKEKKTDKENLLIIYDYSKLQKKGYFYKYDGRKDFEGLKDARKNIRQWIGIDGILRKMNVSDRKFSRVKFCDPNLIEILYNEKGMEAVDAYLEQLEKGRKADKSVLPYKMTYNISSILNNKKLSIKTKRTMIIMARKNRRVADIQMGNKFIKRGTALLMALGLALLSIPSLLPFRTSGNNKQKENSSITEESEKENDFRESIQGFDSLITIENEEQSNNKITVDKDNAKKQKKESFETRDTNEKDFTETSNTKKQEKLETESLPIKLGSLIKLKTGTIFMESVSGGNTGIIGDYSSPDDGIYVIDYVSEVSDQGITSKYGLDGEISKKEPNSEQFVHISFISGAKTQEEAKKVLDEQKNRTYVDESKIQPRGWINIERLQKSLNIENKFNQENSDDQIR